MNKLLATGLSVLAIGSFPAMADITVKLPAQSGLDSIPYSYTSILRQTNAKSRADLGTVFGNAPVKDNTAVLPIGDDKGGYSYTVSTGDRSRISLYAVPGDNVLIEISALEPLDYKMSGSQLADQLNEVDAVELPFVSKMNSLSEADRNDREKVMAIFNGYTAAVKDFVNKNASLPVAAVAVLNLSGEDFINAYSSLGDGAKSSVVYPLVESKLKREQVSVEKERKAAELASGTYTAPEFTLKDLDGKNVSLSDFKGKWVILDFWGSWCPWCIKGFPELKEAYETYKDELVIIGIDCNEGEDAWRKGVAKYELPWVNVYNPQDSSLLEDYAVSGFPTKAIISPDGVIANVTVGHNPEFFNKLTQLMDK